MEKFLGGDDIDSDIVRHDPSFSAFTISICTCSRLFVGMCKVHLSSLSMSVHLLDSAVSVCDGSFAWERDAEPLLKKYI